MGVGSAVPDDKLAERGGGGGPHDLVPLQHQRRLPQEGPGMLHARTLFVFKTRLQRFGFVHTQRRTSRRNALCMSFPLDPSS